MDASQLVRDGQAAEEAGDYDGAVGAFSALLEHPDARAVASAHLHLGRVAWKQGRLDEAVRSLDEARARAIRLGDTALRAQVENAVGVLCVARGELAQARAAYTVAQELTPDPTTRAKIQLNLGVIANIQGHLPEARRHYEQSRATFRDLGDDRNEALALHNLGMLHADTGAWDEADEAFQLALALFESHGNRQMIANVLMNRSEVFYGRGRAHDAIAQCDLALAIYAEIGDEGGRAETMRWRAHGLRLLRQHAEAERLLAESIRIATRGQNALLVAEAQRELGLVLLAQERVTEGRRALERALGAFEELGAEREAREVRQLLGDLNTPSGQRVSG